MYSSELGAIIDFIFNVILFRAWSMITSYWVLSFFVIVAILGLIVNLIVSSYRQ